MAKGAYVGVDGVARKIKKGYVGIDSKAKKIKKGYVGVGGVARPFFSSDGLEYYGTIEPLSEARSRLAATTVGNYALFGGGYTQNDGHYDTVDAYNSDLTRSTPTSLSLARSYLSATTVGDYALFGGGMVEGYGYSDSVDAYDNTLTRSTPTGLSLARSELAATTVGNYALFGGGYAKGYIDTVDAYYQEGASKTQARIVISSTTATGEYSFYLKDTAYPENILAEIVVGEAATPEITLIAGHSYSFTGTSIAPTTPHEIIGINALTPEGKQLSGFFGYGGLILYVSPKFPKHDFINISINISGTDGDSDWG